MTPLDLISTPVPVLRSLGLTTEVGISGDDPLAERHRAERFGVVVSTYTSTGAPAAQIDLGSIGPGDRRLVSISDLAPDDGADSIAVVHRVPTSTSHEASAFHLYRTMLQLTRPGAGAGSVIYETPPGLNDRRSGKRSSALMFSSKVLVGGSADTTLCVIHHSIDPAYAGEARLRLRVFDEAGTPLATDERMIGSFRVEPISVRSLLERSGHDTNRPRQLSVVGWSRDAALIFLFVQTTVDGAVAVEHSHPPQTYLLPDDMRQRFAIKDAAIAAWDAAFEADGAAR